MTLRTFSQMLTLHWAKYSQWSVSLSITLSLIFPVPKLIQTLAKTLMRSPVAIITVQLHLTGLCNDILLFYRAEVPATDL